MDDESTGSSIPDEEPTTELPPADEGATQVLGGESAEPTRVMPAAGAAAPPPPKTPPPAPTLVMSRPPRREGGGNTWWIVLVVIILAAAAAAALWYFVLRNDNTVAPSPSPAPSASPVSWAGAWGRTDGVAGGLVIEASGGAYQVTVYDADLQPTGSAPASVSSGGQELLFTLPAPSTFDTLPGPLDGKMTVGSGGDTAVLDLTAANQTAVTMPLKRVLALVPAKPTGSPSPSSSPSASASPSASPLTSVDQQIIAGLIRIQTGITTCAANASDLYPMPSEVTQTGGVADYVSPWPINPVTNQPMVPGTATGDYTYQQINGGQAYTLVGHLGNGISYTLP